MYPTLIDTTEMFEVADDFIKLDTATGASVDDAGTGTNTLNDAVGGEMSVVTAGADNDYHFLTTKKAFKLVNHKPLNLIARFSLTEANTSAANFVIGVSSDVTATLLGADGAGPSASYSGALIFKVDGTMTIQFETSIATAQTTNAALATFTSGVVYQVGFVVDTGDGTTALVTPWVYNETTGVRTVGTAHKLTLTSQAAAALVFGVKAGSSSAETLKIDYIRCCQKR